MKNKTKGTYGFYEGIKVSIFPTSDKYNCWFICYNPTKDECLLKTACAQFTYLVQNFFLKIKVVVLFKRSKTASFETFGGYLFLRSTDVIFINSESKLSVMKLEISENSEA